MSRPIFTDSDYYRGPDLTPEAVEAAEAALGVTLPASYVSLLYEQNGGSLAVGCFRTDFPTSWAPDHIEIDGILGIGGTWGIDAADSGSQYMINEWGYPPIGVVICDMPSGGHDVVMLDYSGGGAEPTVVYVDEDRVPRLLANSFAEFIDGLVSCDEVRKRQ